MGRIAVLGERARVEGYALAGALVCPADSEAEAEAAWAALPGDVIVVVLTPAAARVLPAAGGTPLVVVMPP
jgi:vacuolar-type H+-ATPase subunit F/Vma7